MKKSFISIALLFFAFGAFAQSSINVQVPSVVSADEQFNVVFSIEGDKPSEFNWDASSDFSVLWGPQQGSSTSVSIINGKTTRSSTTSFTYVLQANAAGTFTLPSATAKVKGKTISSRTVEVRVVSGSQKGAGSSSAGSSAQSGASAGVSSEDLFMRLVLSKRKVVVGESIVAEIKLFQRANIAGFEDVHFPSFDGFWSQELEAPSNVEFHRETVGTEIYNVATLRSYTLVPQQSGEVTIDPAELVCLVNVRSTRSTGNSFFDSFFESDYQTVRRKVATKPVTVNVTALPSGAPASFGGAVGSFTLDASLSRDSLGAHDAASLFVRISGKGNIVLIDAPKISFPPDFESYDPKTTDQGGVRTFEYPFIPRSGGKFTIAPVEFSYWDLSKGQYVTLRTEPMPVTVSRTVREGSVQAGAGAQSFVGVAGRDVKDIGTDVRFIATKLPKAVRAGEFFVWSPAFFILLGLLFALSAVIYVVVKKVSANRQDVARTRTRSASKVAQRRLSRSGTYLKDNLYSAFYQELHRALLGFVSDKLNIDASGQDKDNIRLRLEESGAARSDVDEFIRLLDECEFARYSPTENHDAMAAHYNDSLKVISSLDSGMKKGNGKHASSASVVVTALLLLSSFGLRAADYQQDWTAACSAYSQGEVTEALSLWKDIEAGGAVSSALYCNMGCAYFKLGYLSHSVLYFERALKLDPSYEDASVNLNYVRTYLQDRIESVPEFFMVQWFRSIRNSLSSDAWAVLFIVALALFLALLLVFALARRTSVRKVGFVTALVMLLLCALFLANSSLQRKAALDDSYAVIVSGVSAVRSAPDAQTGTDLFILHEGTKVQIMDSIGGWNQISLTDGRQGWISADEVEVI